MVLCNHRKRLLCHLNSLLASICTQKVESPWRAIAKWLKQMEVVAKHMASLATCLLQPVHLFWEAPQIGAFHSSLLPSMDK